MSDASISVLVPMYNIARYLPDFLGSLEAQTTDLSAVQIIFVDDGSTDESAAIVTRWIAKGLANSRLIQQANGGLSAARNRGLREVTGDWVTFPDPDDMLGPEYFETVHAFLTSRQAHGVHLVATNLLRLNDETGEITNTHPLRFKFSDGQRILDLERHPRYIHLQAASAFYRRSILDAAKLTFDSRIRPNFEDAHLTALYLARYDHPHLAVLPDARYIYRERADGSSLVQSSWTKPEKYTDLLEFGYLELLRKIEQSRGRVPVWTQTLIVYELAFFFRHDTRANSPTAGLSPETSQRFHELLGQIMAFIDVSVIESFNLVKVSYEIRAAMVIGAKRVEPNPPIVHVDVLDGARRMVRFWYYFTGDRPTEEFRAGGIVIEPLHEKVRSVRFLGRTVMHQRITWLPATGTVTLDLDGHRVPLSLGRAVHRRYLVGPIAMWRTLLHERPPEDLPSRTAAARPTAPVAATSAIAPITAVGSGRNQRSTGLPPTLVDATVPVSDRRRTWKRRQRRFKDSVVRKYARTPTVTRRYRDAWLLIDRDDQAQDNAERFYSYLREEQPEINAWFVISRDSPDWDRLRKAGFRLIKHRSRQHTVALMHCRQLISSQVDHYIVHPLPRARFGAAGWKFTFLQHGVTKDDISAWINPKPIDLMITATPDEHESIVGDDTPSLYTSHEVVMTGFPRHDRLLRLSDATPPEERTLILVAPTWRRELVGDQLAGGNERALLEDFWDTPYAVAWRTFLTSEPLRVAAAVHGWDIAFLPHPNMQGYLSTVSLPDHIQLYRFKDVDVQELIARAGVLVTDYSSMAFEAAYVRRPVVYFQFDQDEFFNGLHAYRRGSWSYDESGFGPVTTDVDIAEKEVIALLNRGGVAEPAYAQRIEETFPLRDGRCCERTFEAIRALTRPPSHDEVFRVTHAQPTGGYGDSHGNN